MRRAMLAAVALVALAGCGSRKELAPPAKEPLPVKPYGAAATPTPQQLLEPRPEARPTRNDELLKESKERPEDPFDIPPKN
ncbi:hypothetical protein GCM10023219_13220 [Stakelama sediminis]|uniref:Putative small lipoprotein YifL n=2 Tax=Stakelama sediminis TaxID=463200 RepID=A0A840YWL7_9SPHN|nr:hypothetical protein [Stakelama sediminis]MBB5718048.1 putative small lipoprotein YifL [Stakelama sediminis]